MKNSQLLLTLMILISVGAALVYAVNKDWRHTIYWIAAATLTATVTF